MDIFEVLTHYGNTQHPHREALEPSKFVALDPEFGELRSILRERVLDPLEGERQLAARRRHLDPDFALVDRNPALGVRIQRIDRESSGVRVREDFEIGEVIPELHQRPAVKGAMYVIVLKGLVVMIVIVSS